MNVVEKYDGTLLQLDGSWSDVWSAGTLMNRFCLGKDRRNNELIHSVSLSLKLKEEPLYSGRHWGDEVIARGVSLCQGFVCFVVFFSFFLSF